MDAAKDERGRQGDGGKWITKITQVGKKIGAVARVLH
jgi:hypothetical protein